MWKLQAPGESGLAGQDSLPHRDSHGLRRGLISSALSGGGRSPTSRRWHAAHEILATMWKLQAPGESRLAGQDSLPHRARRGRRAGTDSGDVRSQDGPAAREGLGGKGAPPRGRYLRQRKDHLPGRYRRVGWGVGAAGQGSSILGLGRQNLLPSNLIPRAGNVAGAKLRMFTVPPVACS